jgi:hypothetical protein
MPAPTIPAEYMPWIQQAAQQYNLSPALLAGLLAQESDRFNPAVISGQQLGPVTQYGRAVGIGQFLPSTAAQLGIDPLDPRAAIFGAAQYLGGLIQRYGSADLGLAAYNGGPGAVQALQAGTPYGETSAYLTAVNGYAQDYAGQLGGAVGGLAGGLGNILTQALGGAGSLLGRNVDNALASWWNDHYAAMIFLGLGIVLVLLALLGLAIKGAESPQGQAVLKAAAAAA